MALLSSERVVDDYTARRAKLEALRLLGINPYPPQTPKLTHTPQQLVDDFDSLKGTSVSVAGRMLAPRIHGGITFVHLQGDPEKIQAVASPRAMGATDYKIFVYNFDRGDFVRVAGVLDKTRRGEKSVFADHIDMLAKALRGYPEIVIDPETIQRQRYLDLLANPESKRRFEVRSQVIQYMREYFIKNLGAIEVETPILDTTYGGASARPFVTHHNSLNRTFYLRIATELYLKRLTLTFQRGVFEIGKDFRNEGMDKTHHPEFSMAELYMPYWDYHDMMEMTENLISGMMGSIHGTTNLPFGEHMINFAPPWRRLSVYDGLRDKLKRDPRTIPTSELTELAHSKGVDGITRGEMLLGIFDNIYKDELIQPTFVYDYPAETSVLAKRDPADPEVAQRFEAFAAGMEFANAYSEQNDPEAQRIGFELERRKKDEGENKEAMPYDQDFLTSQEFGMPPQAGLGLGIERIVMLASNSQHMRNVILFPHVKPLGLER